MKYKKLRTYKYEILNNLTIKLPNYFNGYSGDIVRRGENKPILAIFDGNLFVSSGFKYDGASGLTIDTANSMFPALIHDSLYLLMREQIIPRKLQKEADVLFRKLLIKNGMNRIRAWLWYRAVRRFGHKSTEINRYKCPAKKL